MKYIKCFWVVLTLTVAALPVFAINDKPDDDQLLSRGTARGCPFDYSPCECLDYGNGYELSCVNATAAQIQNVFNQSDASEHVRLNIEGSFISLPADLLSGKRVREIVMKFYNPTPGLIDADALRSSQDYTTSVDMTSSEATVLNMTFLNNFTALQSMSFRGEWTAFRSIPALPSLKGIYIASSGYKDLLSAINLYKDTLESLAITSVYMSTFPKEVEPLSRLTSLDLRWNQFGVLPSGSIAVSGNLTSLGFYNARITAIEPGTFRGDFSQTYINLGYHQMDKLEELAFRNVLQSMEDRKNPNAYIDLSSDHSLICDCNLAWLLVNNRHLLSRVQSGYCMEPGTNQVVRLDEFDQNQLVTCSGGTIASTIPTVPTIPTSPTPSNNSNNLVASFAWLIGSLFLTKLRYF